jgi:hypothetical protein
MSAPRRLGESVDLCMPPGCRRRCTHGVLLARSALVALRVEARCDSSALLDSNPRHLRGQITWNNSAVRRLLRSAADAGYRKRPECCDFEPRGLASKPAVQRRTLSGATSLSLQSSNVRRGPKHELPSDARGASNSSFCCPALRTPNVRPISYNVSGCRRGSPREPCST